MDQVTSNPEGGKGRRKNRESDRERRIERKKKMTEMKKEKSENGKRVSA